MSFGDGFGFGCGAELGSFVAVIVILFVVFNLLSSCVGCS